MKDAARPGHAEVRVVYHEGTRWRVYESRLGTYDRRSGPHLFFESEAAVRRVRDFPPDWFTLPDAELTGSLAVPARTARRRSRGHSANSTAGRGQRGGLS